mmetsp:Transcript_15171/g.34576  ORF Transcript_15171/g.34576 Transcript_15171/m.34576 type:complete len:202 (+) Transcript_15171:195-800(+)
MLTGEAFGGLELAGSLISCRFSLPLDWSLPAVLDCSSFDGFGFCCFFLPFLASLLLGCRLLFSTISYLIFSIPSRSSFSSSLSPAHMLATSSLAISMKTSYCASEICKKVWLLLIPEPSYLFPPKKPCINSAFFSTIGSSLIVGGKNWKSLGFSSIRLWVRWASSLNLSTPPKRALTESISSSRSSRSIQKRRPLNPPPLL